MVNNVMTNIKVHDIEESIRASKYPMAVDLSNLTSDITKTVRSLGNSKIGSGHDQFLTGILVSFDLRFSIKAWTEMERYNFINFVSSQSTMHRIAEMNLTERCNNRVWPETIKNLYQCIKLYNELEDKSSTLAKEAYLEILYNIPVGLELTARMTTNYRQLKTIYFQRRNHKLPEWVQFCAEVEELPYFKELCLGGSSEL